MFVIVRCFPWTRTRTAKNELSKASHLFGISWPPFSRQFQSPPVMVNISATDPPNGPEGRWNLANTQGRPCCYMSECTQHHEVSISDTIRRYIICFRVTKYPPALHCVHCFLHRGIATRVDNMSFDYNRFFVENSMSLKLSTMPATSFMWDIVLNMADTEIHVSRCCQFDCFPSRVINNLCDRPNAIHCMFCMMSRTMLSTSGLHTHI